MIEIELLFHSSQGNWEERDLVSSIEEAKKAVKKQLQIVANKATIEHFQWSCEIYYHERHDNLLWTAHESVQG